MKQLLIIALLLSMAITANATPKVCGERLEIETILKAELQRKVGFTVSSTAGRLELWTTEPTELGPGIFKAARWTGISVKKEMCIEVEGADWIFMPWEN